MKLRISICVNSVYAGRDFVESIYACAAAGVKAIDMWSWREQDMEAVGRALAQTGKMSYQIMLLDPFYKVVLFAAAGKLFGGMPLALLPLIAAADFTLGVITCMVIRKIPGVRILFGL